MSVILILIRSDAGNLQLTVNSAEVPCYSVGLYQVSSSPVVWDKYKIFFLGW